MNKNQNFISESKQKDTTNNVSTEEDSENIVNNMSAPYVMKGLKVLIF